MQEYQPVYELAMRGDIDVPFDFMGYIMGRIGKIFGDELSYPEITKPYYKLCDVLMGGLSDEEFWKTDYYKKRLLPSKFHEVVKTRP